MWLLEFIHTQRVPLAVVFVVCALYYFIRTRYYPSFRPNEYEITRSKDSTIRMLLMKDRASKQVPFSEEELDVAVQSIQYAVGNFTKKILYSEDFDRMEEDDNGDEEDIDWMCLRGLIGQVAHNSHKDWSSTERSAGLLTELIGTPDQSHLCCKLLERVLEEGGWWMAEEHATARIAKLHRLDSLRPSKTSRVSLRQRMQAVAGHQLDYSLSESPKPWVVVVCGLNGIRKTTSIYQPWFQDLLRNALSSQYCGEVEDLPTGKNSFFRQLDFMIATVACEDFRELYAKVGLIDVAEYSKIKDAIFARYRTLAEMVGIMLVKEARLKGMNIMIETSGKDVASFRYVDHLFPDSAEGSTPHRAYNKLMVHFTIDDIKYAEKSVDRRMKEEMSNGMTALGSCTGPLNEEVMKRVITVNAGGPYGSNVLRQVQQDSDAVMHNIFEKEGYDEVEDEFSSWFKARICIHASDSVWSASAYTSSNVAQERFKFENKM